MPLRRLLPPTVENSPRPSAFSTILRDENVAVEDEETAVAVVVAYLETTSPQDANEYLVTEPEQIDFRPDTTDDARDEIVTDLASEIEAPAVTDRTDDSWTVTAHVMHNQQLQRRQVVLDGNHDLRAEVEVVADGLPTVLPPPRR